MFKVQARYVVSRMEPELWEKVLTDENQYRRQLIDQVRVVCFDNLVEQCLIGLMAIIKNIAKRILAM